MLKRDERIVTGENHWPSLKAPREALVNEKLQPIEVPLFHLGQARPVAMRLSSPGPLTTAISVEKIRPGQRSSRNPQPGETLRDSGCVDAPGMGVHGMTIALVNGASRLDARFEAIDSLVRIIVSRGEASA